MAVHYTYLDAVVPANSFPHAPDVQKMILAVIVGALMVLVGKLLTRRLADKREVEAAVIPSEKVTAFGFVDLVAERWVRFQDSILGVENRAHAPFTASVFFFILLSNILGLVPGFPAITTTVWINVGMALVVFMYFNVAGIKASGAWNYFKHFAGPVPALAIIIFPLEILSTCLRVLTLNLRLYWNISADHIVLGIFTDLVPALIPIVFYAIGTFVAFMQAFVFTLLTMVYIRLATAGHHDEEHDHASQPHGQAH